MYKIKEINLDNLEEISIGAAFLGTGGGGDPYIGYLMAKQAISKNGPVKVVDLRDMDDSQIVASVSTMGAPSVMLEKIPNGTEHDFLIEELEKLYNKKIDAIYPVEAGGVNSLIPVVTAANKGLPLVDADTMGRAFPELQMVTFEVKKIKNYPIVLTNEKHEKVIIDGANLKEIEDKARFHTVEVGGSASVGDGLVSVKEFKQIAIKDIVSKSYLIGHTILNSSTPLEDLKEQVGVKVLFKGKIIDILRKTEGGFNKGFVSVKPYKEEDVVYKLDIQNENLIAYKNDEVICCVPDLITLIDENTFKPITTDTLKYGQRVIAVALEADDLWKTKEGLEIVGPKAFGYDMQYKDYLNGAENV